MIPQNNKILVEYVEITEHVSEGGIVLNKDVTNASRHAVVLNPGNYSANVSKGDVLLFEDWALFEMEMNHKKYHFVEWEGVAAIVYQCHVCNNHVDNKQHVMKDDEKLYVCDGCM